MRLALALASTCMLAATTTGCAGAPIPVNYAPSSVLSASGSLQVGAFSYPPAEVPPRNPETSRPASNQIRNTALGDFLIDRDVKVFVRDAVFSELRLVGIKMGDARRLLTGRIDEFMMDDLGHNIDWTLRVTYQLVDPSSKSVLYTATKSTERRTSKWSNVFGSLNETIKLNAEELIKDDAFLKAIQ